MKILSKFHDYYDKACQWGIDTTQLFIRNTTQIKGDKRLVLGELFTRGINGHAGCIWFCGEAYPFICVRQYSADFNPPKFLYFFDIETFKAYVLKDLPEVEWGESNRRFSRGVGNEARIAFHKGNNTDEYLAALAVEHKCPYLCIESGAGYRAPNEVYLYPVLKDYNFQKVKDPYTAFQDIQSYKFGVLGCNENEVVTISDKDRIAGKGFDTKYGFRTRPHKEK